MPDRNCLLSNPVSINFYHQDFCAAALLQKQSTFLTKSKRLRHFLFYLPIGVPFASIKSYLEEKHDSMENATAWVIDLSYTHAYVLFKNKLQSKSYLLDLGDFVINTTGCRTGKSGILFDFLFLLADCQQKKSY